MTQQAEKRVKSPRATFVIVANEQLETGRVGQNDDRVRLNRPLSSSDASDASDARRNIDVVETSRVDVDGVESLHRSVED